MRACRLIAAGALLAWVPAAQAQVVVNPGALDALPKAAPTPHRRPAREPARRPAPSRAAPAGKAAPPGKPAPPSPPARPPVIPPTPPAILAIPPPVAVPLAHPPPPPPVPVAADAPGTAAAIPGGLRVTFGPDRSDLNPTTEAALRDFARGLKDEATSVNVYAYAAGNPEDPSTPRRLSLARALTVRGALMSEGIASPRIYPRALGPAGGDAGADRVDLVAGTPQPPAAGAAP